MKFKIEYKYDWGWWWVLYQKRRWGWKKLGGFETKEGAEAAAKKIAGVVHLTL